MLATNDSKSFVGDFTSAFGADGAGTIGYALSIGGGGGNGSDSGLVDTATGFGVFLYLDGGDVVGRVGSDATTPSSTGAIVFRVSESSGTVTLDQVRAVVHDPNVNANDTETLSADNLIQLTATITDKDGDQDTAVLDIGQNLTFVDDGPALSGVLDGPNALAFSISTNITVPYTFDAGADGGGIVITDFIDPDDAGDAALFTSSGL